MPVKKMKVDVYDEDGNKYTISIEGRVTRKKALRILDIVELLGGMHRLNTETSAQNNISKFEKVQYVVEKKFLLVWFSAKDVIPMYKKEIGESISLSTLSTYLSRLSERGLLIKKKNANKVIYRLMSKKIRELIKN